MPAGHEIKRLRAHVPADRRLSFLNEAELHLMCKKNVRMQSEDAERGRRARTQSEDAEQRMQCEDVEGVEDADNVIPSSP